MSARSSWKGFLKLSLISVPLKAYPAQASSSGLHLNQLHRGCHCRIKYKKTCPTHGEIPASDIVNGYEYASGEFVEIDPDELSRLRASGEKAITVEGFIHSEKLDPLALSAKTYYLLPDGRAGEKPYALLHRAMSDLGVFALAQVVLSRRERLVVLRPRDDLLTMTTLYLKDELRSIDWFDADTLRSCTLTPDEQELLKTLIEARTAPEFDLAAYRDAYTDNLTQLIESKVEGREIFTEATEPNPKILNLMDALKRSVAEVEAPPTTKATTPQKNRRSTPKRKVKKRASKAANNTKQKPRRARTKAPVQIQEHRLSS